MKQWAEEAQIASGVSQQLILPTTYLRFLSGFGCGPAAWDPSASTLQQPRMVTDIY